MPNKLEVSNGRRKLLKSLAASGGFVATSKSLPEQWSKPVVDAVLLPAHAQTTEIDDVPTDPGPGCTINVRMNIVTLTGIEGGAGSGFDLYSDSECIDNQPLDFTGPDELNFPYTLGEGTYYFRSGASFDILGGSVDFTLSVNCCMGDDGEELTINETGTFDINEEMFLLIEIGDDGSCSISRSDIPDNVFC